MKTYIVGAGGFLGSHLTEWMQRHGPVLMAPSYTKASADTWRAKVLATMREFAPDCVLLPGASQAMGDDAACIGELLDSNCALPCLVASEMADHLPNSTLVVFGTSWQYADSETFRPFNLYAASKQAARDLLTHFALRGLKIAECVLFDTYGERDTRRKLLNILQEAQLKDEEIGTTPAEQEIDLVHIDDVCAGVDATIREAQAWDTSRGVLVRGLGSGHPISVRELINRVGAERGRPLRAKIGERSYRPREVMKAYRGYTRPAGWAPRFTTWQSADDQPPSDEDQSR